MARGGGAGALTNQCLLLPIVLLLPDHSSVQMISCFTKAKVFSFFCCITYTNQQGAKNRSKLVHQPTPRSPVKELIQVPHSDSVLARGPLTSGPHVDGNFNLILPNILFVYYHCSLTNHLSLELLKTFFFNSTSHCDAPPPNEITVTVNLRPWSTLS